MEDEVTVQMRFAMAMTQADGEVCDEERALFYMDWLKRNGLAVVPAAYVAAMGACVDALAQIAALIPKVTPNYSHEVWVLASSALTTARATMGERDV